MENGVEMGTIVVEVIICNDWEVGKGMVMQDLTTELNIRNVSV